MNWRPHTQEPDTGKVFTALIAVRDADIVESFGADSFYLLNGIYHWRNGQWEAEGTGLTITEGRAFWWLPENEVLAGLNKT